MDGIRLPAYRQHMEILVKESVRPVRQFDIKWSSETSGSRTTRDDRFSFSLGKQKSERPSRHHNNEDGEVVRDFYDPLGFASFLL